MENPIKKNMSVYDAEKIVMKKMENGGFGNVVEAIDEMKFHTQKNKLSEATRNRIIEAFNAIDL